MDAASGTFGVRLALPNSNLELPAGVRCKVTFSLRSVPAVAPKETLIEPSVADPTTTEAIKLPPSQPIPTMSPTAAPPTGIPLLASPPVATDGELTLPAAPLRATATDNDPPTPPATIAIGNLPLPIPSAAMSPAGSLSLLAPPDAPPRHRQSATSRSLTGRRRIHPPQRLRQPQLIEFRCQFRAASDDQRAQHAIWPPPRGIALRRSPPSRHVDGRLGSHRFFFIQRCTCTTI
jgi:hypothetical protein